METVFERIILGIDPGTQVMGYGLIGISGTKLTVITLGGLRLNKTDDHFLRLKQIFEKTIELIDTYTPDELSIEAPFFGKNVQSMLKLGRAQGVAMAAGLTRELPIFEYSPKRIKQSITGNGNASKEQVAMMLERMLKFKETPEFLDATDGLAAAVCHYFQAKAIGYKAQEKQENPAGKKKSATKITKKKKSGDWSSFITENPERVQAK